MLCQPQKKPHRKINFHEKKGRKNFPPFFIRFVLNSTPSTKPPNIYFSNHPQSVIRNPPIRNPPRRSNPQSVIRNPQSVICNPQSVICNPPISNPQSLIRNPQSANLQSAIQSYNSSNNLITSERLRAETGTIDLSCKIKCPPSDLTNSLIHAPFTK